MYTLKIKVTKEILEKSQYCGYHPFSNLQKPGSNLSQNCAFAEAVREIFPNSSVGSDTMLIRVPSKEGKLNNAVVVELPKEMRDYIRKFDVSIPEVRIEFEEEEFELPIPDSIIDLINIDEIQEVLKNVPYLELVK